jgi:crescentin
VQNRRLDERLKNTSKRVAALESDLNGTRQRLQMSEDEKHAQQAMLEKASSEAARLSRKLAETEASFNAAQGRLRSVEANFAELSTECTRLASAFDEANERHAHEINSQRMRFESLQARAQATEKLLGEAREHLLARADELGENDLRNNELAVERDALQTRVSDLEAERIDCESLLNELEQERDALAERFRSLARAYKAKESALARSEETVTSLNERVAAFEQFMAAEKQSAEQTVNDLSAALRREQMERSVVEGALETARKDFSRVMRELMALQRRQSAEEPALQPQAANAA